LAKARGINTVFAAAVAAGFHCKFHCVNAVNALATLLCHLVPLLLLSVGLGALYTLSQKNDPTLKWYSSKLYASILMTFCRNIQKTLE